MIPLILLILYFSYVTHERCKAYAGPIPFWIAASASASADASRAYGETGAYYKMAGNLAESEKFLKESIRRNPQFGPAMDNLSWVLWDQGKHREALATIRICTERCPNYGMGWQAFATMLDFTTNNHHPQSGALYQKAVDLDPRIHRCWNRLGVWYAREKQFPRALECCETARGLASNFLEYSANSGLLRMLTGDRPGGEQLLASLPQPIKVTSESLSPQELGIEMRPA